MSDYSSSEAAVIQWINSTAGASISSISDLKSGVVLCNLVNKIRPNTITTVNNYTAAYRQLQNIDNFLTVAGKIGVSDEDRFKAEDLFYENNLPKVVLTLLAFHDAAKSKWGDSAGNLNSGNYASLRDHARSSQKSGKSRAPDAVPGDFLSKGMKDAQAQASSANRGNDRIVKKGMQEMEASSELGFIDADKSKHQALASTAHGKGMDQIVRNQDSGAVNLDD